MNKANTTLHILDMAPTTITSRSTLLPRQRRSAATDTTTTSSGVAISATPTAVEVQYSLKLDCSKVAQDLAEGSKSLSELLYDKAL